MEVPFSPDEQVATNSKKTETTGQKTVTRRIRCIEFKNGHPRSVGSRAVVIDTYGQPPRADGYACFDAIPGVGGAAKATRTRGRAHVR